MAGSPARQLGSMQPFQFSSLYPEAFAVLRET